MLDTPAQRASSNAICLKLACPGALSKIYFSEFCVVGQFRNHKTLQYTFIFEPRQQVFTHFDYLNLTQKRGGKRKRKLTTLTVEFFVRALQQISFLLLSLLLSSVSLYSCNYGPGRSLLPYSFSVDWQGATIFWEVWRLSAIPRKCCFMGCHYFYSSPCERPNNHRLAH